MKSKYRADQSVGVEEDDLGAGVEPGEAAAHEDVEGRVPEVDVLAEHAHEDGTTLLNQGRLVGWWD